jgi:hypothetical protein
VDSVKKYIADLDKITQELTYKLTWNKGLVSSIKTSPRINVSFVLIAVFCLVAFGFAATKIYRLGIPVTNVYEQPIGSWMVLPLLGLFISPFIILYSLFTGDYFNDTLLTTLKTSDSMSHISWDAIYIYEICGNLFILSLTILCLVAFLNKRDITPRLMIYLYSLNLAFIGLDYFIVSSIDITAISEAAKNKKDLVRAVVAFAIWVPYFMSSRRVKDTFIVPYGGLPAVEPTPVEEAVPGESPETQPDGTNPGNADAEIKPAEETKSYDGSEI